MEDIIYILLARLRERMPEGQERENIFYFSRLRNQLWPDPPLRRMVGSYTGWGEELFFHRKEKVLWRKF